MIQADHTQDSLKGKVRRAASRSKRVLRSSIGRDGRWEARRDGGFRTAHRVMGQDAPPVSIHGFLGSPATITQLAAHYVNEG